MFASRASRILKVVYGGALSVSLSHIVQTEQESAENAIREADVVIIGGGIVGTSLAYYLSQLSNSKHPLSILVLEKAFIGSGASGIIMHFS
jgi:ribulose 1,5-bisphosphate synthetase/thiazole synthase